MKNLVDMLTYPAKLVTHAQEDTMVALINFLITYETSKGSFETNIKAFTKQQAKRKLLSTVSTKHDEAVVKKIEQTG